MAMGISDDDEHLDGLTILSQLGAATDIRQLKLQLDKHSGPKFDIIIIDALYKALPKDVDENSNGQITSIYNLLDNYALATGAAIVLVHHTSKGNQSNKSVTDIGSGAGAQSRSPMLWLPKSERGKRAEQWFQCEYCGGCDLTLRYLSPKDAMRRK